MHLSFFLAGLLGAVTIASPLRTDTGELTESPAKLLGRDPTFIPGMPNIPSWAPQPKPSPPSPPTCKVKTVFGPFTLKSPILGFDQNEVYYAEKIADIYVITSHGKNAEPLDSNRKGPERDFIVTKHITLSWTTSTYFFTFPGHHHATRCETTKTISPGFPGFPSDHPILPKPIPHLGWPGAPAPTKKSW